jgi:2-desacetyl-2-hydroxyethyl bacteriochlorophyllide A dehydrogenase
MEALKSALRQTQGVAAPAGLDGLMDVVVCTAPGQLDRDRRPEPEPGPGEVLVRVRRVGVCGTDMHIYRGTQPYLTYPRVMGHELSGEVVTAPDDSGLHPGEPVYVLPYLSCGVCSACRKGRENCCMNIQVLGVHRDGAMARFIAVPARFLRSAQGVSLDAAAMIEFLAIGAHAVRRADVRQGQSALVVGAGPIGIAAALFAKLRGAVVTVVDRREDRLAFCREQIGVDHILAVDEETPQRLGALTAGDFFDVVFDATGSPAAMEAGFAYVAHGGTYVLISVVGADITFSDPEFHRRETTLLASRNATPQDFETVIEAMRNGKVPIDALNTHKADLMELPDVMEAWMDPASGVIKAIVAC